MPKAANRPDINLNNESGFTLIDISIALVVLSILIVPFIWQYNIEQRERIRTYGDVKYGVVTNAFRSYLAENGRYPFPADPTLTAADAGHGREIAAGAVPANGTCTGGGNLGICAEVGENNIAGTGGPGQVVIGSVPYVTLGISPEDATDYWGSSFTYMVSFDVANATVINNAATGRPYTYEELGAITVTQEWDDPLNPLPDPVINNVQAVYLGHGRDNHGSYNMATGNKIPCDAGKRDTENCDLDAHVWDSAVLSWANTADDYDDRVQASLFQVTDDMWERQGRSQNVMIAGQIDNRPSRVGIGTTGPDERLHVVGNVQVEESHTTNMCDEDGNDCFPAEVIGGGGIDCPAGELMLGTETRAGRVQAVCDRPDFPIRGTDITCPANEYVVGIHYNPITTSVDIDCEPP